MEQEKEEEEEKKKEEEEKEEKEKEEKEKFRVRDEWKVYKARCLLASGVGEASVDQRHKNLKLSG